MEQIGTTRDGRTVLAHAYRTGHGLVIGLRADMFPDSGNLNGEHYELANLIGCIDAPASMPAGALRAADDWRGMREAVQHTSLRVGF